MLYRGQRVVHLQDRWRHTKVLKRYGRILVLWIERPNGRSYPLFVILIDTFIYQMINAGELGEK